MVEEQNLFEPLIERERKRKGQYVLCALAIGTAVICYLLLQIVFGVTKVDGESMEPEIQNGSIAIFCRLEKDYKEGDVVIAKVEGRQIVKRILTVDGGSVFLMGDNQAHSIDSRTFGEIDSRQILGKVICVIRFL